MIETLQAITDDGVIKDVLVDADGRLQIVMSGE